MIRQIFITLLATSHFYMVKFKLIKRLKLRKKSLDLYKFIKDCMSLTDWPTEIPTYRTSLSGLENNYNIWLSGKKVIEISKKFLFYINPMLYLWYCKCLLANPIYAIFDSLICWIESASPLWELPGLNSYSWLDKRGSIHPFQTITKWANRTVLLRTDRFWITISL